MGIDQSSLSKLNRITDVCGEGHEGGEGQTGKEVRRKDLDQKLVSLSFFFFLFFPCEVGER